jgi:hypothetical protein
MRNQQCGIHLMKTEQFTGNPPYSILPYSPSRWWGWGGDDQARSGFVGFMG